MREKIEKIIKKLQANCDYLDIRVEERENLQIGVIDGQLQQLNRETIVGGAVRVCHKGSWGFVSFNDLSKMESFAKLAIAQAKKLDLTKSLEQTKALRSNRTNLATVPPVVCEFETPVVDSPQDHSLDEKISTLLHYDEVMKSCPSIVNRSVKYGDSICTKFFASSEGSFITQRLIDLYLGVNPIARFENNVQKGKIERGSSTNFSVIMGLDEEIVAQSKLAVEVSRAPKVKAGDYPVIICPTMAGLFVHEAFGHLCEADNYTESPQLAEVLALGRKIGPTFLNVYDTGLDVGTRGFVAYDDEGVKAQKTYVVKQGILVSRLHTRETAALLNEEPTGNGRAVSYRYGPMCRMRNTCIERGETSFSDMVSSIGNGLYLVGCQGGFSGEDFSLNSLYGFVIRDGELQEKVSGATLTGNLWHTLEDVEAIGDDFEIRDSPGGCGKKEQPNLAVSFGSPHLLLAMTSVH